MTFTHKSLAVAVCAALLGTLTAHAKHGKADGAYRGETQILATSSRPALLQTVVVPPFQIVPQPLEGVAPESGHGGAQGQAKRIAYLSAQLAEHLDALLLNRRIERERIAGDVRRTADASRVDDANLINDARF